MWNTILRADDTTLVICCRGLYSLHDSLFEDGVMLMYVFFYGSYIYNAT